MHRPEVVEERLLEIFPRPDETERRLQSWPGVYYDDERRAGTSRPERASAKSQPLAATLAASPA